MLPAVSAEDCLVADLGLDPGEMGCQSYEATAFLVYRYRIEPAALLILWQVGFLGQVTTVTGAAPLPLDVLVERLGEHYPDEHEVIVYEAAVYPILEPLRRAAPARRAADAEIPPMATLVVPPAAKPSADEAMIDRLGLPRH